MLDTLARNTAAMKRKHRQLAVKMEIATVVTHVMPTQLPEIWS